MEQLISKEEQSEKKPLNIVLLGDESSEKEKLMSKFLLLNSPQFQENEMKNEEDKEEDISLFQNIIHCVEIHGEKLKMKLWDNPSTDEFLSPSIKIAQGILLFYSVKNKKSYEKIQKDLSKIIELGRFDIPIIVIGNHKNSEERKVTYEEAKTWADNYGLRFYETSLEKDGSIKEILQDIGEQLLFQECIFSANNSVIINEDEKEEILNLEENLNIGFLIESKNKESEKKEKEKEKIKNEKNKQKNSLFQLDKEEIIEKNYSSNNIFETNSEIKNYNKKNKFIKNANKSNHLYKMNSSNNFQKTKSKITTYNKPKKEKEDKYLNKYITTNYNSENISNNTHNKIKSTINTNSNSNKISNLINYSKLSIINKTKNLFKKNSSKNLNKTTSLFHSKKNSVNTLELSSPDAHSYLKKTTLTKNREKEIKEKKIKIEKESQTKSAQREREGIELKKKKNLEDKENYLKKIKEDKITQKEKEKKKREDEIKSAKNNYDKLKQEKELISQEKKIEKEKDKLNKLALKQSEKEKYNKRVEELNKEREKVIENVKFKKERDKEKEKIREKNNISPNKHRKENSSFNLTNNFYNKFKSENINNINKNRKDSNKINKEKEMNKEKEKELKEKIISITIGKETTEKTKAQEEYKTNFINNNINEDIYRCLKCNSIPKIFFHENNQEIEVLCDHSNLNDTHHNIISYQNFQTKILDKSLYENTICYFCNKTLNKLEHNEMIYYCPLCKFWFCSKDENLHIKHKHQNEFDIKNKYKNIITPKNNRRRNSIEFDMNKKQNLNNHPANKRLSLKSNLAFGKQDLKESKESETKSIDNKEIPKKQLIKIPIYLLDIFCKTHYEKYNSYCYTCHKNICNLCQKERHKDHNIENFDNIMPDQVELNKKKIELQMIKENLSKINEYFIALIEAIKCRFERLYKAKQKEIEIKEKIIKDYEKIKYNYNSILNIKNLNLNNKQNFINSTNNINWIERLNLIFEYLNCSLTNEKCNIFRDLNNSNKYKKENIYFNNEEIKNIIKLNDKSIALINNKSELKIYSTNNFNEKLKVNIFKNGEEINHIIKLRNNELACCGYEQIKFINFDSINQKILVKNIIKEKNNNFLSLIELTNDYLISSGTSKKIKLWNKDIINIYKCLNELNDIEINLLYNIDINSFIGCSYNNKKIKKYFITNNKEIIVQNELNNISIIKGNNSIIKYNSNLFINHQENNEFGTLIINIDKFEVLSKISNVKPLFFINNNYENENLISIDEDGFVKKWKFSKKDNKLYECDKIKIYNNNMKLKVFFRINKDNYLLQYPNNIILYYKNKEYS